MLVDSGRYALIVGNSQYSDKTLRQLITPGQDAEALAQVLEDPAIGKFKINVQLDINSHQLLREIDRFFGQGVSTDTLLFYFSGHGLLEDYSSELYLAVKDTERDYIGSTAIPSDFILRTVRKSFASSKIIILDCCYSGAITNDTLLKGPPEVKITIVRTVFI